VSFSAGLYHTATYAEYVKSYAVERVIEDKPEKVTGPDGKETHEEINYGGPNPNGFEVDNLYRQSLRVDTTCVD
jgi:hypothetical protein